MAYKAIWYCNACFANSRESVTVNAGLRIVVSFCTGGPDDSFPLVLQHGCRRGVGADFGKLGLKVRLVGATDVRNFLFVNDFLGLLSM